MINDFSVSAVIVETVDNTTNTSQVQRVSQALVEKEIKVEGAMSALSRVSHDAPQALVTRCSSFVVLPFLLYHVGDSTP